MDDSQEKVILVNSQDQILGLMDKLKAHENGILHRAFSVFLLNKSGEILLQKRSSNKYHSPNLWTNACCSHPRENESYLDAAKRRLKEELGIETPIEEIFHFTYRADVGQGLWEHELDHVFLGNFNGDFNLDPNEVSEIKYLSSQELDEDINSHPEKYTEWFKIIWKEYRNRILK